MSASCSNKHDVTDISGGIMTEIVCECSINAGYSYTPQ